MLLSDVLLSEGLLSDLLRFSNWKVFEFVTKKKGASGPTKTECIGYYKEKLEILNMFLCILKND